MKLRTFVYFCILLMLENTACKTSEKPISASQSERNKIDKPLVLTPLEQAVSIETVYSKNINVGKLEAFDIDSEGNIYYARLGLVNGKKKGENRAHIVFIYKGKPNQPPSQCMTLKYFGHPYNIAVETEGGQTYIWINSNGSKHKNGKYWDARSVSKIKYIPGKIYVGYGGETYFLNNGQLRTQVALNRKSNLICISARKDKDWYFYTYRLSEVESLPDTLFTFSVILGGEDLGTKEQTISRTVKGHDLSKLVPLGSFSVPGDWGDKPEGLSSFYFQGYSIDKTSHIYFFEGEGKKNGRPAQAYVTVFDINGRIKRERTKIKAILSSEDLDKIGIANQLADMEAEGITVKGNSIYLGFLSRNIGADKSKKANIFRYDCSRELVSTK